MSLGGRQLPESIKNRDVAADKRFFDGVSLYCDSRRTAAVYLLGYCAEILVKNAYYRYRGKPDTAIVGNVRSMMKGLGVNFTANSHDLEAWGKLLVQERKLRNNGLNPAFAGVFIFHVARVRSHWRETLRYSSVDANESEVGEVYESVEWLMKNYQALWS